MENINTSLLDFIRRSPTAFHTAENAAALLRAAGFTELDEAEAWPLAAGRGYFVRRNSSAVIAFSLPQTAAAPHFQICASHGDSPCLRVKDADPHKGPGGRKLAAETYGGGLWGTWFDRPLSLAGRVLVREGGGLGQRLVRFDRDLLMLPSVPIHFNRTANDGVKIDAHVDLDPLFSLSDERPLDALLAEELGVRPEDIAAKELSVCCRSEGFLWGSRQEFLSSPRLDDLQCAYGTLRGFLASGGGRAIPVWACLDNEETGSMTKQGAAGTFLADTLARIGEGLGLSGGEQRRALAASFLLSADNAHAVHPNHSELYDAGQRVVMNGGIVLKHAVAYSTDAVSGGLFRELCRLGGIPVQDFSNRSDIRGGSTLANIATGNLSIPMADIGLAQLAMHAAFETAGAQDTAFLTEAARLFYSRTLTRRADGVFRWEE